MGFLPGGIGWQRKEAGNDGGKFPARRGTSAVHSGRKLFAESFLLAVAAVRFMAAGNCLRKFPTRRGSSAVHGCRKLFAEVSYLPWQQCGSWLQETVAESFPTRRGTSAVHSGRKLISTKIPAHGRAGIGDDYFTSWIMGRIMGRRLVRS